LEEQKVQVDAASGDSFWELKKQLTIALLLVMPDMEKPFLIFCDALEQGLGCVLM
jgi:hypothetical protein